MLFALPETLDNDNWALAAPILEGARGAETFEDCQALWGVHGYVLTQIKNTNGPGAGDPGQPHPPEGSGTEEVSPKQAGEFARSMSAPGKGRAPMARGTYNWGGLLQIVVTILGQAIASGAFNNITTMPAQRQAAKPAGGDIRHLPSHRDTVKQE